MSKISFRSLKSSISRKPEAAPPGRSTTTFQPNADEMKKIFNKFDTNGDGKISLGEYNQVIKVLGGTKSEVAKAFQVADADGDGFIDFEEFAKANGAGDGGVESGEIEAAFGVFDADGNGKISAEELMGVLRRMGERCSLEACRKMIRGVDRDGDGLIDKDEFVNMMTQTMKII